MFTPFAWVAVELARTYITGFPWDLLGTTQIDNIPLSRIATVTGVYGISFEIALVNTAVAAAFLVPYARRKVLLTSALVAAIVLHAGKLIKRPDLPAVHGATLVQANIPILDSDAWSLDYFVQTLDSLRALSVRPQNAKDGAPGLIVWPESPAPFWAPICICATRWPTSRAPPTPTSLPARSASTTPAIRTASPTSTTRRR